jgi:hypothetical protein
MQPDIIALLAEDWVIGNRPLWRTHIDIGLRPLPGPATATSPIRCTIRGARTLCEPPQAYEIGH